jgi:hypothetical protein
MKKVIKMELDKKKYETVRCLVEYMYIILTLSPNSVAPTIVNPLANAEVKELETGAAEGSLGSVDKTKEKRSI